MTLLDLLAPKAVGCIWCATIQSQPCPAHGEMSSGNNLPRAPRSKRRRWHRVRITPAERRAAQDKLMEGIRRGMAERNARITRERQELIAKARVLPEGVRIVEDRGQDGADRE